ncbi:MAG: DUF402 domain-containing protein [Candidatus Abyssobacteria bacterium SURF_5]|uniref:DUF402 domain-containing protein n=1 Tax=Abyssobacteria bacterium (strain SURF_5) TaxID=2093360 RepID=A0A3A4NT47_ABYX5|nr:MAG: DUF402 domain-containing protein [Candidatus Abyssubacteria bacterium SURF_5]
MSGFLEIKRHLNKPDERYRCELVRREPAKIVLKYRSDRSFQSSKLGVTFPPGCVTLAFYWLDRPYVFWAIYSPEGEPLGYLVHICREMEIFSDSLTYVDLLLDIWFSRDGDYLILDQDEVDDCVRSGKLADADVAYIDAAKEKAIADFPQNAKNATMLAAELDISR